MAGRRVYTALAGGAPDDSRGETESGCVMEKGRFVDGASPYMRATLVQSWHAEIMATRRKTASAGSVRQSVTIPATLAADVRRVAKDRRLTMSRALVALAERRVRAEAEAKQQ